MFFSNPSERDFSSFIAKYVSEEMSKRGESKDVRNFSGGIAGMFAENNVERTNLIFASYYHLNMTTFRNFGAEIKDINMIGLFGTFIPMPNK